MTLQPKKIFILITGILIFFAFFLPISNVIALDYVPLAALPGTTCDGSGAPCGPTGTAAPNKYIPGMFNLIIGVAAILAIIMITLGGVKYMMTDVITSKGDAKKTIQNALYGLLLTLGSWLILNTINPDLTNLKFIINEVKFDSYTPSQLSTQFDQIRNQSFSNIYNNFNTYQNPQQTADQLKAAATDYQNMLILSDLLSRQSTLTPSEETLLLTLQQQYGNITQSDAATAVATAAKKITDLTGTTLDAGLAQIQQTEATLNAVIQAKALTNIETAHLEVLAAGAASQIAAAESEWNPLYAKSDYQKIIDSLQTQLLFYNQAKATITQQLPADQQTVILTAMKQEMLTTYNKICSGMPTNASFAKGGGLSGSAWVTTCQSIVTQIQ